MGKEDSIICDSCDHFEVSPSGVSEACWKNLLEPYIISDKYWDERRKGNKDDCKCFTPIKSGGK